MQYVYSLSGNTTPLKLKFQIGEAMANAGVPVVVGGSNNDGIMLGDTTTASVDLVGITLDTQATLVTAQQSDNSDPSRLVTVIVDPQACFKAKLSGGATENTALTQYDVTTESTDGLTVTTGDSWSSPQYDEGVVWGYDGANAGQARKITGTSSTAATVMTAFANDINVGDNFLRAGFAASPVGMEDQFVQLTTALTQINASVQVDTDNNNFRVLELLLRDKADNGVTNSYAIIVPFDSIFAGGGSI